MRAARAAWCIAVQRPVSLLSYRSHRAEPSAALRAAHIQARAIRSYYDIQSRDMDIQQRGIRNRHRRIADAMPRARPGLSQVPRHRSERGNRRRVRSAERSSHSPVTAIGCGFFALLSRIAASNKPRYSRSSRILSIIILFFLSINTSRGRRSMSRCRRKAVRRPTVDRR